MGRVKPPPPPLSTNHVIKINKNEEAVRLRRLNKRKSDYLKSLVNLKSVCSNFKQKITKNKLEIAKYWEDRFEPKSEHQKKNRII